MTHLKNKKILITGGTGSFGRRFVDILLKNHKPKKIIIFSRDELKQYQMKNELVDHNKILRYFLGDIRDLPRLRLAIKDANLVVHAAALKHVESGEYNPFEVVKTNIIGSQNVVDSIIDSDVTKAIFLSTDKAVSPINLYGASKLAAEKIFVAANNYSKKLFSVVKYGNVFNSRGSVLPTFLEQIKKKRSIEITDKEMTRFNISLDQGIDFVISCFEKMLGGETFIPKMSTIKIFDLIKVLSPKKRFNIIGIRPGEKIHEELISDSDNSPKIECKDYFIILPSLLLKRNEVLRKYVRKNKGKIILKNFSYNSKNDEQRLNLNEIKLLIKNNVIVK